MSSEQKRITDLEQKVVELESRLASADVPPLIVPKAVAIARTAFFLSCLPVVIELGALAYYVSRINPSHRTHLKFEEILLLVVPFIFYPILCGGFGYFIFRGTKSGTAWGRRLAVIRIWMALPLVLVDVFMIFLAGLMMWPNIGLIMLSLFFYIVTEALFLISGIMVWRSGRSSPFTGGITVS